MILEISILALGLVQAPEFNKFDHKKKVPVSISFKEKDHLSAEGFVHLPKRLDDRFDHIEVRRVPILNPCYEGEVVHEIEEVQPNTQKFEITDYEGGSYHYVVCVKDDQRRVLEKSEPFEMFLMGD